MILKHISSLPQNEAIAIVLNNQNDVPAGLLSDQENAYVEAKLADNSDQWISINQYNRLVFLYLDKKESKSEDLHVERIRMAGANLTKLCNEQKIKTVALNSSFASDAFAEGALLGNYQFLRYRSDKDKKQNSLEQISSVDLSEAACKELNNLVDAVYFSRDLVNTPVWDLNAEGLADAASSSAKAHGFSIEVLNKKKIESLKMGGLLAVNKGSIDPPTFIIMEHKPKNAKNSKPIVLVGKGVVYDTGGLSLKPTAYMDDMKCDMGGSAAVIGAMQAISSNDLPYHVVGLVPATDNRPGGNAVTPGDVITISNGKTVEVMNTDAEGRLILSDALVYAQKYKPELVIDLATLTGAAANAIGRYGIVAMGDANQNHWNTAKESGNKVHERLVEFPFWDDYDELIESPIADLKNIGGAVGGAITAGKFLANFIDYPYIHLDIAGPAFVDSDKGYIQKGATGVGVRLLYDLVKNF